MTTFNEPQHQSDEAARQWFEALRWPDGTVCPHCGSVGRAYARSKPGLYRCAEAECRMDFTVRTKSVLESSHIPLRLWAQAFTLLCSSKKGISAHQVHRTLKITYKSAWFLCHRIREAMRQGGLEPLGGKGKVVEADETYFGEIPEAKRPAKKTTGRPFSKNPGGPKHKRAIVALVERGGSVRSFHVPGAYLDSVVGIVRENVARESRLHTDESPLYKRVGEEFAAHETVKHSDYEYARGDVTTNTVESYFSVFKRGMRGIYQHCDEKHLHRYLAEYDFRYNHRSAVGIEDGERAALAVKSAAGKRLTYRQSH
jgi:transposase-like protein